MNATHCYVAFADCGHWVSVTVDDPDPELKRLLAKDIAAAVRAGHRVERITMAQFRDSVSTGQFCPKECNDARIAAKKSAKKAAK